MSAFFKIAVAKGDLVIGNLTENKVDRRKYFIHELLDIQYGLQCKQNKYPKSSKTSHEYVCFNSRCIIGTLQKFIFEILCIALYV